ncbi:hypothetical protein OAV62_01185, partial [bacterium]|nr:hypothetical protein [bacterium]
MFTIQDLKNNFNEESKVYECVCGKDVKKNSIYAHMKSNSHIRAVDYNYDPIENVFNCPCGKKIKKKSFAGHLKTKAHLSVVNHSISVSEENPSAISASSVEGSSLYGIVKMKFAMEMMKKAERMMEEAMQEIVSGSLSIPREEDEINEESLNSVPLDDELSFASLEEGEIEEPFEDVDDVEFTEVVEAAIQAEFEEGCEEETSESVIERLGLDNLLVEILDEEAEEDEIPLGNMNVITRST